MNRMKNLLCSNLILPFTIAYVEYATVGYVEKRIRLRKAQFTMMQKIVNEKKKTVAVSLDSDVEHAPRQTVSFSSLVQFL